MPRDDFVDLCRELLSPAGAVRAKRMFGGHGLYVDDLFVAIVTGVLFTAKDFIAHQTGIQLFGGK